MTQHGNSGLVQYIVVRADLHSKLKWPWGAVIAQACHASIAAIHEHCADPNVLEYLNDINHMRKVVVEVEDEESLKNISNDLNIKNILHKLWIEQPENVPTCVATAPASRNILKPAFQGLKLFTGR